MKRKFRAQAGTAAFIVTIFLAGCLSIVDGPKVDREVKRLAGPDAMSCGLSLFANIAAKHNQCALDAVARHTPFWIRYEIRGGKTVANRGIAMNGSGQIFIVTLVDGGADSLANVSSCRSGRLEIDPEVSEMQVLRCVP